MRPMYVNSTSALSVIAGVHPMVPFVTLTLTVTASSGTEAAPAPTEASAVVPSGYVRSTTTPSRATSDTRPTIGEFQVAVGSSNFGIATFAVS